MKYIFRIIGFVVVVLVLLIMVLCYLDSKGLLTGDLGQLIGSLRVLGGQAWLEIRRFFSTSGIGDDAANLLEQGADYLRATPTPDYMSATPDLITPTPQVIVIIATPIP